MRWLTSRRTIEIGSPLVMGILNVTPDSFSDGGSYVGRAAAVAHAERMIAEGAGIIDIGGESTRPGSEQVDAGAEVDRVVPVIRELVGLFDVPISIDTTKGEVAQAAISAGADIINDISGLRWDTRIADVAAECGAGLIVMHSRGSFETMHATPPDVDIVDDVVEGLHWSVAVAKDRGVRDEQIAVDIGIGFGKTVEQNLELLRKLDTIVAEFDKYALLVGTSRKSFIGKIMGGVSVEERLPGSLATALIAARNGANILRVHDIKETVQALKLLAEMDK